MNHEQRLCLWLIGGGRAGELPQWEAAARMNQQVGHSGRTSRAVAESSDQR